MICLYQKYGGCGFFHPILSLFSFNLCKTLFEKHWFVEVEENIKVKQVDGGEIRCCIRVVLQI